MNPADSETGGAGAPRRSVDPERFDALAEVDTGGAGEVTTAGSRLRFAGQYVRVGNRLAPAWVEITIPYPAEERQPQVMARVEVVEGSPHVVKLAFTGDDLRQSDLRAVQLDSLLGLLGGLSFSRDGDQLVSGSEQPHAAFVDMTAARGGRRITRAFLEEVAKTYRANVADGPTRAVRERFFVSERQASNYVQRCRREGLLPQTTPGRKKG